jgi:hypothetical protein
MTMETSDYYSLIAVEKYAETIETFLLVENGASRDSQKQNAS